MHRARDCPLVAMNPTLRASGHTHSSQASQACHAWCREFPAWIFGGPRRARRLFRQSPSCHLAQLSAHLAVMLLLHRAALLGFFIAAHSTDLVHGSVDGVLVVAILFFKLGFEEGGHLFDL